jgi:hypothetical protein
LFVDWKYAACFYPTADQSRSKNPCRVEAGGGYYGEQGTTFPLLLSRTEMKNVSVDANRAGLIIYKKKPSACFYPTERDYLSTIN